MAYLAKSIVTVQVITTPGAALAAPTPVPDNCNEVLIRNIGAVNTLLVAESAPGPALPAISSIELKPGEAITLGIGVQGERPYGDLTPPIAYDSSGGATTAKITYLQRRTVAPS